MKLTQINEQFKTVHDIVAFKWIKSSLTSKNSSIFIPETIHGFNDQRLGHKYVCKAISCGPDCASVKNGDRFFLHEYSKIDQGDKWDEESVMFCHEKEIKCLVPKDFNGMSIASEITEDMEDHYKADDSEVEVNYKQD
jgi:hypothetical protein